MREPERNPLSAACALQCAVLLLSGGCAAPLADETPYIDSPRLLAVRAEPPEAEAGAEIAINALAADSSGALAEFPVDWSFCRSPRPLAELGPVASSCLAGEDLEGVGAGLALTAVLPDDGCSLFGPNPPPPEEGEPAGRPVDPDITGGYYQPLLGFVSGAPETLFQARLRCGLANVSQEIYVAWNRGYHSNANPEILGMELDAGAGAAAVPQDGAGEPPVVAAGAQVTLQISWPDCPAEATCGDGVCTAGEDTETCPADCDEPVGCGGAESYIAYDSATQTLIERREALSATWFTTGGTFDDARNGRSGADTGAALDNVWTAPATAGSVWLAAALRDERGGVAFQSWRIEVGE